MMFVNASSASSSIPAGRRASPRNVMGLLRFLVYLLVGTLLAALDWWLQPVLTTHADQAIGPLTLFGKSLSLGHHAADALLVVLPLVAALLAEYLSTGGRHSSLRPLLSMSRGTARKDMAFVLLGLLPFAMPLLSNVTTLGFVMAANHWVRGHVPADFRLFDASLAQVGWGPTILLFYLSVSLFDYLTHRLLHTPLLWPLHRLHHAATSLTPATSLRDHPADQFLAPLVNTLPMLIWAPPEHFMHLFLVLYAYQVMFVHTDAEIDWGWLGRHVYAAPLVHKLHHSAAREHMDRNFSANLLIWDRLFGTFTWAPTVERVGIDDPSARERSLPIELLCDLRDLQRNVQAALARVLRRGPGSDAERSAPARPGP